MVLIVNRCFFCFTILQNQTFKPSNCWGLLVGPPIPCPTLLPSSSDHQALTVLELAGPLYVCALLSAYSFCTPSLFSTPRTCMVQPGSSVFLLWHGNFFPFANQNDTSLIPFLWADILFSVNSHRSQRVLVILMQNFFIQLNIIYSSYKIYTFGSS